MATRRKGKVDTTDGPEMGPEIGPMGLDLDDVDSSDDDLDEPDLDDASWRPAVRRPSGGRGARSLPHDWADFDFGGGTDDWR